MPARRPGGQAGHDTLSVMADDRWVQPFLQAVADTGKIAPAARRVGIDPQRVYARRDNDVDFAAALDEAIEECRDSLEVEMVRRARDGTAEPVVYQGALQYLMEPVLDEDGAAQLDDKGRVKMKPVVDEEGAFVPLTIAKKSDTLLTFALKGYRKEVFAERTELTGAGGKDLDTPLSDVERTTRLAAIVELARQRKAAEDDIG